MKSPSIGSWKSRSRAAFLGVVLPLLIPGCEDRSPEKVEAESDGLVVLATTFPPDFYQQCGRRKVPPLPKLVPVPRQPPSVQVPAGTVLLSQGRPVSSSDNWPIIGVLEQITDGEKGLEEGAFVELSPGLHWIQVDLGESHPVHAIAVWHEAWLEKAYHDVVMQISDDPEFRDGVTTVYNNDFDNSSGLGPGSDPPYVESRFGKLVAVPGVRGRYVRLYSRGNTDHDMNRYIEVEVYGVDIPSAFLNGVPHNM